MDFYQACVKRGIDLLVSFFSILVLWPLIALCWVVAAVETRSNGFFLHKRIGRHGVTFNVIKIKTMRTARSERSAITAHNVAEITRSGRFFRKYKLDELPQLINVLLGDMSLVGPRPDVSGYADLLEGADRSVLSLRPGITGPASLKYRNEEEILANVDNPQLYNDEIIWPDKVRINREYATNYSIAGDFRILLQTIRH